MLIAQLINVYNKKLLHFRIGELCRDASWML